MPDDNPSAQAPRDTDAKSLHKAMLGADPAGTPYVTGDGLFTRNLNVFAAEIGWTPDRVSLAMQELVAQDLVLPMHDDGRADRVANSRWLVLDAESSHVERYPDADAELPVTEFDAMDADQLRAFAEANDIDLGKATSENGMRAKIQAHLDADPNADGEA